LPSGLLKHAESPHITWTWLQDTEVEIHEFVPADWPRQTAWAKTIVGNLTGLLSTSCSLAAGEAVLVQTIEFFRRVGAPPNLLVEVENGYPVIFRAQTAEVARLLLEALSSDNEMEAWLNLLDRSNSCPVVDHLTWPRGGGDQEEAEVTCKWLAIELKSLYENRDDVCRYYFDVIFRFRGRSTVLRLLRFNRSFLEHIPTPSWIKYLFDNEYLPHATPNAFEIMCSYPQEPEGFIFNPVLADHYRATLVNYFRCLRLALTYLRRVGRLSAPSSWDLFTIMRAVSHKTGPFVGYRGLVRLLIFLGGVPDHDAIQHYVEGGYYQGLFDDILSVTYFQRWADIGCFGAREVEGVQLPGLPKEIVEMIAIKTWEMGVDDEEDDEEDVEEAVAVEAKDDFGSRKWCVFV
jgi:hypothetical protein